MLVTKAVGQYSNIAAQGTATQVDDWRPGGGGNIWGPAEKAIDGSDSTTWQGNAELVLYYIVNLLS